MNSKPLVIILLLLCIGLGIGWFVTTRSSSQQRDEDATLIVKFSNDWSVATTQLKGQQETNSFLETNLLQRVEDVIKYSNDVVRVKADLTKTEEEKNAANAAIKEAQAEMAKRDAKIADLESQRDDLTKRMTDLNTSITGLEGKITDTEKKLQASEGDREFLLKELKRLQAEKAELERQFNDLATLREQVRKLRDELSIAKRLEWLRRGFYGSTLKGAERLTQGFAQQSAQQPRYDLDVELKQDGSGRIVPSPTNGPASTNQPGPK